MAETIRKPRSVSKQVRLARHEAGHAVLGAAINDTPDLVSIRANGVSLGRSRSRMDGRLENRVQVHLAGFAAEELLTGRRPRQLAGPELGFSVLAVIEPRHASLAAGFEGCDQYLAVKEILGMGCPRTRDAIRAEFERFYVVAKESLSAVWPTVQALANALLKHKELDRNGVFQAIGRADIFGPIFAVQKANGLLVR